MCLCTTHSHTHTLTHTHTHTHVRAHTHAHTHMHTHIQAHAHTHTHTHTHTHAQAHTHTHTHTHNHTHTHARTYTQLTAHVVTGNTQVEHERKHPLDKRLYTPENGGVRKKGVTQSACPARPHPNDHCFARGSHFRFTVSLLTEPRFHYLLPLLPHRSKFLAFIPLLFSPTFLACILLLRTRSFFISNI